MAALETLPPGISQSRRAACGEDVTVRAAPAVGMGDETTYNDQGTPSTSTRANVFDGGAENTAFQV